VCGDAGVDGKVSSSNDGIAFKGLVPVRNGEDFDVPNGRYLRVQVTLRLGSHGEMPRLRVLRIATAEYDIGAPLNAGPVVSAGPDGQTTLPDLYKLNGSVCDDGLPSGTLSA